MKNTTRNIFFAFGLIAVIVMLFTFKVSFAQLWADICHAGYWLIAILGLWIFLYIMNACTWRIIIRGSGDCPIPFWKILKLTITGFALNYATPAGLMGGEPYKIMELKPYIGTQRATSSVLLFAMMHIFAHFWFWALCCSSCSVSAAVAFTSSYGAIRTAWWSNSSALSDISPAAKTGQDGSERIIKKTSRRSTSRFLNSSHKTSVVSMPVSPSNMWGECSRVLKSISCFCFSMQEQVAD